ncbi:MAG: hypothetical protein WCR67_05635 [Bacilli bacterium]
MTIEDTFSKGIFVSSLLKESDRKQFICCRINGRVKELSYAIPSDGRYIIEFLPMSDPESLKMYSASMRFLVCLAVNKIEPKVSVRFFYNVSRSLFVRLTGKKGFRVTPNLVKRIKDEMDQIIKDDVVFERIKIAKNLALDHYRKQGYVDKIKVLKYRKEEFVHLYKASYGGVDYFDYLYEKMVPSAGYLTKYSLRFYIPGMMLQIPRFDCNGDIPMFEDEVKFAQSLATNSKWAESNGLDSVPGINKFIKDYSALGLIDVAESRMNDLLCDLARDIVSVPEPIRCILIAGPSSSGKTSFANRLRYQLMTHALRPIRISIDDFYKTREQMEPGTDIESVEALDVDLFNSTVNGLIEGMEMSLPVFDFKSGSRTFGKPISIKDNQPLIIEGIHALNPTMTAGIASISKYKIFIAPQPQVNLDDHTPLSMSDMRLLRRITRDSRTRNSSASETIAMWPNVRGGEFKYIYPTQENADFIFDSFMPYELSALRNMVLPILDKVKNNDDAYPTCIRLKQMVKYFLPIEIKDIPCNSLIREFVGGSSFKDAR